MHAAIRHLVKRYPNWKPEFGLPVNQEDLTGTLMAFDWISLDGLRRIGVDLTQDEWDGYLHCWQIVGHQLGIRDDMIPADNASAEAFAGDCATAVWGVRGRQSDDERADRIDSISIAGRISLTMRRGC